MPCITCPTRGTVATVAVVQSSGKRAQPVGVCVARVATTLHAVATPLRCCVAAIRCAATAAAPRDALHGHDEERVGVRAARRQRLHALARSAVHGDRGLVL